jgi:hypothetical protein
MRGKNIEKDGMTRLQTVPYTDRSQKAMVGLAALLRKSVRTIANKLSIQFQVYLSHFIVQNETTLQQKRPVVTGTTVRVLTRSSLFAPNTRSLYPPLANSIIAADSESGIIASIVARSDPVDPPQISPIQPGEFHALLKQIPIFSSAPPVFIDQVVSHVHLRQFAAGDRIIREGEIAKAMFIIVKGSVTVCSADGECEFAELQPGNFFGGKTYYI